MDEEGYPDAPEPLALQKAEEPQDVRYEAAGRRGAVEHYVRQIAARSVLLCAKPDPVNPHVREVKLREVARVFQQLERLDDRRVQCDLAQVRECAGDFRAP